jgi:hypothetical protein
MGETTGAARREISQVFSRPVLTGSETSAFSMGRTIGAAADARLRKNHKSFPNLTVSDLEPFWLGN